MTSVSLRLPFAVLSAVALSVAPAAQGLSQNDAYLIREMLRNAYETVKAHYYDATFHGLDWDARYREFSERLKTATSVDAGEVVVAQFLEGLKDSHTFFQPPARSIVGARQHRVAHPDPLPRQGVADPDPVRKQQHPARIQKHGLDGHGQL